MILDLRWITDIVQQAEFVVNIQRLRFLFFIDFVILRQVLNRAWWGAGLSYGNEIPACGPCKIWEVNKSILIKTYLLRLLLHLLEGVRKRPDYLCILAFLIDNNCLWKIVYRVIDNDHEYY